MNFRCFSDEKWVQIFRFRWYSVGLRWSSERNPGRIRGCSGVIPCSGFVGNRQDPARSFPARNTASIFRVFFRRVPVENAREPVRIDGNKPGFRWVLTGFGWWNHRHGICSVSLCIRHLSCQLRGTGNKQYQYFISSKDIRCVLFYFEHRRGLLSQ
jgi:hypothetical protein